MRPEDILKQYYGYDSFREGQKPIIDALLNQQDVLAVMPTGAGKSICYQVPAMMFEGITLVISPLISLMKDQVMQLVKVGIPAAYLNSSLNYKQQRMMLSRMQQGRYKIIYLSPERLMNESFQQALENTPKISMIAVDEAHCVSQWGQDFRPDYLKIAEFVQTLSYRPRIAAFTATATKYVKDDILKMLQLQNPFRITTGFDRPNLRFSVMRPENKDLTLLQLMEQHQDEFGIVYCQTRELVENVTNLLSEHGYKVARYHAGLSLDERKQTQEDFIYDRIFTVVCTNAFGMGIDKPNVSYIIHYNMPKDMESYYQEAGRAGRDGEPGECILLYDYQDVERALWMINNLKEDEGLDEETKERILAQNKNRLYQMQSYATSYTCLRAQILHYFGQEAKERCENCSNCSQQFYAVDITKEAQQILVTILRTNSVFGTQKVIDILKGANTQFIRSRGLEKVTTYGMMSALDRKAISSYINTLLEQHYIVADGLQYPVLKVTKKGAQAIRLREKIEMRVAQKPASKIKISTDSNLNKLFVKLKELRHELANEEKIPAYMIFTDASLKDMAQKKPSNEEGFLKVKGVGELKMKKYGARFLEAIAQESEGQE
jgi:ATP-dependent DNA helicase RecQ